MNNKTMIASLLAATLLGGATGHYVSEQKVVFSIQSTSNEELFKRLKHAKLDIAINKMIPQFTDVELHEKAVASGYYESLRAFADTAKSGASYEPDAPVVVQPPVVVPEAPNHPTNRAYWSIHQQPLRIATPPVSGYEYGNVYKAGFKEQYNPDDSVAGCLIGIAGKAGCAFPGGPVLGLGEFTNYLLKQQQFKIYIPAGATEMTLSGYYPQNVKGAFALKFGAAPSRSVHVAEPEYGQAQRAEKVNEAFKALVTDGRELVIVHDGGGSMRFIAGKIPAPLAQGGWLYIKNLNGSDMYDIQGSIYVDLQKYVEGYRRTSFDGNGDPQ